MTPQTFSLEMCRHLSSLVPEFEGHYWWVRKAIFKAPKFAQSKAGQYLPEEEPKIEYVLTCHEVPAPYSQAIPAWQVEDVLRNWWKILEKIPFPRTVSANDILLILITEGDTACQKIEEYLWSILK